MQVPYEYLFRPVGQKEAPKFLAGAESRGGEILKKTYIIVFWVEKDRRRVEIIKANERAINAIDLITNHTQFSFYVSTRHMYSRSTIVKFKTCH